MHTSLCHQYMYQVCAITLCHVTGKGRGVIVTEDVKAGQLLSVGNPVALAAVDATNCSLHLDMTSRTMVSRLCLDMCGFAWFLGEAHAS